MSGKTTASPAARRAQTALVFFAKAPIPGEVKTRLCPPLTPDEAASLHGSFVLDALERSAGVAATKAGGAPLVDRFLACAPSSEHVFFKILSERHGVRLLDQQGPDVGTRMDRASRDLFELGYLRVLLTGTDLPTMPASVYHQAADLLAGHDVVLGPALDGGYVLIGLTRPQPHLFRNIPWSTDQVLALTRRRTEEAGLKVGLLSFQRDVDTIADLRAIIQEGGLAGRGKGAGTGSLSKRTEGALRLLAGRYPDQLKAPS